MTFYTVLHVQSLLLDADKNHDTNYHELLFLQPCQGNSLATVNEFS